MPTGKEPCPKPSPLYSVVQLDAQLAVLPELDHAALKRLWQSLLGREPPSGMSQPLLRHAIAYRLQETGHGGLRPATGRYLVQVHADGKQSLPPTGRLKPGTRLLREWHGRSYEVTVLKEGVQFKGKQYRSLSEVARLITGAQWSGPLFFGLRSKRHG